jgi:hypothetical protein
VMAIAGAKPLLPGSKWSAEQQHQHHNATAHAHNAIQPVRRNHTNRQPSAATQSGTPGKQVAVSIIKRKFLLALRAGCRGAHERADFSSRRAKWRL